MLRLLLAPDLGMTFTKKLEELRIWLVLSYLAVGGSIRAINYWIAFLSLSINSEPVADFLISLRILQP